MIEKLALVMALMLALVGCGAGNDPVPALINASNETTVDKNTVIESPTNTRITLPLKVNLDADDFTKYIVANESDTNTWLDASKTLVAFDATDVSSYNFKIDTTYQDADNFSRAVTVYFRQLSDKRGSLFNLWQVITVIDHATSMPFNEDTTLVNSLETNAAILQFDEKGELVTTIVARQHYESPLIHYQIENSSSLDTYHTLALDFTGATQYGASYYNMTADAFPLGFIKPGATSLVNIGVNIDQDSADIPFTTKFSRMNSNSYHHVAATTVYDSQGSPHVLTIYFRKMSDTLDLNTWAAFSFIDAMQIDASTALHKVLQAQIPSDQTPLLLKFHFDGKMQAVINNGMEESSTGSLESIRYANGALAGEITLDFKNTTQYGAGFSVYSLSQNGNPLTPKH